MKHDTIAGLILISTSETKNMFEMKTAALQGFSDQSGTALTIEGSIKDYTDSAIGASYAGTMEYSPVNTYAIGMISPYAAGITILAVSPQAQLSKPYQDLAEEVMHSVKFRTPDVATIIAGWEEYLSGYRLRKMDSSYDSGYDGSGTGHSTDIILDLCPNKTFTYSNNSSFTVSSESGGGAYGSSDGSGHGTWSIGASASANPVLQLHFANGEEWENNISVDNEGKTYLNGSRVFRVTGNDGPVCR